MPNPKDDRPEFKLSVTEEADWLRFYGKMFPKAKPEQLKAMAKRMMRTICTRAAPRSMTPYEFEARSRQLLHRVEQLSQQPPPPGNRFLRPRE